MGGGEKIVAAGDERHALKGIVHHDGQMISRRRILARQYDIAEHTGFGGDCSAFTLRACAQFFKKERPRQCRRFGAIEPQGIGHATADAF